MREGGIMPGHCRDSAQAPAPGLRRAFVRLLALGLASALALAGCAGAGSAGISGGGSAGSSADGVSETSGPAFERPELALSPFDPGAAFEQNGALIDLSHLEEGYVAVSATSDSRLKFQVSSGSSEYNYDLPSDGTPLSCPLTSGDGSYTFTVWENTSGNRYVELAGAPEVEVVLSDEFQPFVRPSAYCDYDAESASTALADELCAGAENEGEALRRVYEWIVGNIAYDEGKAERLADATGYLPDPDATIADGSGICFDYASLAAALLRSQGIPTKIVTGNVSPDEVYHAWNMVYIDGTWIGAGIDVRQGTWTRIDTTFAAGSGSNYVGDGMSYTDRYTY